MSQAAKAYLILACLGIIVAILWGPLRTAIGGLISTVVTPAVGETLKTILLWMWWLIKTVVGAHWIILKNLLMPRRVIFPRLEDEDDRKL